MTKQTTNKPAVKATVKPTVKPPVKPPVTVFNKANFVTACNKAKIAGWLIDLYVKSYTGQAGCKALTTGQAVNNCNRLQLAGITNVTINNAVTGKPYNKQAVAQLLFYICKAQKVAVKSKAVLHSLANFGVYFGTSGLLVKQAINGIVPLYMDKAGLNQCDKNKWTASLLKQSQSDLTFTSNIVNAFAKNSNVKASAIVTALQGYIAKQSSITGNDKALLKGALTSVKSA